MFVRQKKNPSGLISVQVISKHGGKYKVEKTIGSSSNMAEVDNYVKLAQAWIKKKQQLREFDFTQSGLVIEEMFNQIAEVRVSGIELLLGGIYDSIGFGREADLLFKHLVLMRLCYPSSKLKTTEYLARYTSINVGVQQVYRYLDKLHKEQKEKVEQLSYRHTLKILRGKVNVLFYDVTTLYFETEEEDELRKRGYSKDGKDQLPQVLLGLLVSTGGYPIGYEIFEGNKFEGHTMLPVLEKIKGQYQLGDLVVVADSGLLSKRNINDLTQRGYGFILGARIKNETAAIQSKILGLELQDGQSAIIPKDEKLDLVVGYTKQRAKKDKINRERGFKKLQQRVQSGKLTKNQLNNKGYNKYLIMTGDVKISIDEARFNQDACWDGLKGYITNTGLSKEEIISNYGHLWRIEKAFRISKHDLKIRPVYHRVRRRIEAHVCIAFVAYKIYKELERLLAEKKADITPEKAIEIAKTIYAIKITNPMNNQTITKSLFLKDEQKMLAMLFEW